MKARAVIHMKEGTARGMSREHPDIITHTHIHAHNHTTNSKVINVLPPRRVQRMKGRQGTEETQRRLRGKRERERRDKEERRLF